MQKNIVEVYKEKFSQLIILISGLSGSGKTELSENISRDFKLELLDTKKFFKKDYDNKVKLPNGVTITNYDSDDAFNWTSMNNEINELKTKGVVVVGHAFPTDKLEFIADFHIHLKISKQDIKQKRMDYIAKHPELGTTSETETLRINMYTYPYYLDTMKRMKMNKVIDVTNKTNDEIYDITFDDIIKYIKSKVYVVPEKLTYSSETERLGAFDEDYYVLYESDN